MIKIDQSFMQEALRLAEIAFSKDEVPVGAILVQQGKIIGRGFNQPIMNCDPTAHAEMIALRDASKNIQNYRLIDTTLYVTLEPCLMCAGALINARVRRVVFGAEDMRWRARENISSNHAIVYEGGVMKEECADLLQRFFAGKR